MRFPSAIIICSPLDQLSIAAFIAFVSIFQDVTSQFMSERRGDIPQLVILPVAYPSGLRRDKPATSLLTAEFFNRVHLDLRVWQHHTFTVHQALPA